MEDLIKILESKVVVLILGFVLTSIIGKYIADRVEKRNWKNKTKAQLYIRNYEEGKEFIDELSVQIGERYFLLQRLLWAIKDIDKESFIERKKEYFKAVVKWNTQYWCYRNKIRILIGDEDADLFLDNKDDGNMANPNSIHYKFAATHAKVIQAEKDDSTNDAQAAVYQLNYAITSFLENLTSKFQRRANNLKLLNFNEHN